MLRRIAVILIAISCLSASPTWFAERSLARLTFNAEDENGEKATHSCTGFMVNASKGLILTAEHCVPKDGGAVLVDGVASEVMKKNHDFALIQVEPFSRPPLEIETSMDVSDPVIVLGYGYGDLLTVKRTIAATRIENGLKKAALECELIALDGPIAPGMSGGPIINARGKVIGISQATAPAIGLGCKGNDIKSFIR